MIGLDSNVLIRYITQDDKDQAEIAGAIIEPGYINQIVICEIVWVLRRAYGYEKKIVIRVIQRILQTSEMVVENSENVRKALDAYKNGKADYRPARGTNAGRGRHVYHGSAYRCQHTGKAAAGAV